MYVYTLYIYICIYTIYIILYIYYNHPGVDFGKHNTMGICLKIYILSTSGWLYIDNMIYIYIYIYLHMILYVHIYHLKYHIVSAWKKYGLKSYTGKFWRHHWLTRPHRWSKSMRENQHILPRVYPQTRCRKVPLVFERDCDYMNTHSCLYSVPNSEFEILQSPNHFTVIADSSHSVHNPPRKDSRAQTHTHTHLQFFCCMSCHSAFIARKSQHGNSNGH